MRLGFDIDGVLGDFNAGFIDLVIEVTGEDKFPPRPFEIPVWDYPEHYGYMKEQTSLVWNVIKDSETFWERLPLYPWSMDVLDRLSSLRHAGHDIYFVTSRPGRYAKLQTEHWLRRFGYDDPTVLISNKKGFAALTLDLETYIDDKNENLEEVSKVINNTRFMRGQEAGPAIYKLNQPWNLSDPFNGYGRCTIKRVDNPLQMLDELFLH